MTGTLFVVATPIGNLEDITLRALRVLREADVVAAEDTRRTGNLLRHYQISTPLVSLHEHNERERVPRILERLRAGRSVALVSDAGTPGICDPGAVIIQAVREAGLPVVPIPGASSLTAILGVSGVVGVPVSFLGFPPVRSKDRRQWFHRAAELKEHAVICFESPHRLQRTLRELASVLGERPIFVGREVTKRHEEWLEGTAQQLSEHFAEPQGEFVLLIRPDVGRESAIPLASDADISALFGQMTIDGLTRREAVRSVADRLHLPVRVVYLAIERTKKIG